MKNRQRWNRPATDSAKQKQLEKESHSPATEQIYGLVPIIEALRAGQRPIEQITIAAGLRSERLRELLSLAKAAKVPVHRVPAVGIRRALKDATHQGVVAKIAAARYHDSADLLDQVCTRPGVLAPLVLALDSIEDPRNFGAILRTAECTGVDAVFIPERRAVGLTDTVSKAAAGAIEYVPVARVTNLVRLIGELKERNIWVIGASGEGSVLHTKWDWKLPTALVLGSEGTGLHRLVRESCDALVRIPVVGKIESLNVSVAAGVLLYEALRQRSEAGELVVKVET